MDTLRVVASLLFVVALLGGVLWFIRTRKTLGGSAFTLLQYHAFGPKRGVAALRVYDEVLVLGITAENIRLLKSYPAADVAPGTGATGDRKADFMALLGGMR